MPWEEFVRNAEAQAHPIPTESECAFIKIPRWFTVHSQSLRSTVANYSELLDQLRWKENRLLKLHYCTVSQIEGRVHVLLFLKFSKMIKAKSIYCLEHKKCLNHNYNSVCRWQCSLKTVHRQIVGFMQVKWLKEAKCQAQSSPWRADGRFGRFEIPRRTHHYRRTNAWYNTFAKESTDQHKCSRTIKFWSLVMWEKPLNTHSQLDSLNEIKMIYREDRKDIPKRPLNTKG